MKKIFFILFFFINLLITNISSASEIIKYPLPEITNYPPSINGGQTQSTSDDTLLTESSNISNPLKSTGSVDI